MLALLGGLQIEFSPVLALLGGLQIVFSPVLALLGGLKMCFLSWVGSKFTLPCRVGSK